MQQFTNELIKRSNNLLSPIQCILTCEHLWAGGGVGGADLAVQNKAWTSTQSFFGVWSNTSS